MSKHLAVKLISVESGIAAMGFRKIAAIARSLEPEAEILFLPTDNLYSLTSHFFPDKNDILSDKDYEKIAVSLAEADIVAFSSMTASAFHVEKIAVAIKKISPRTYLLWGGVHPTLYPDESIAFVDAICIGEGERPFKMYLEKALINETGGAGIFDIPSMWFRSQGEIIRNKAMSLTESNVLSEMPHSYNQLDCKIYDRRGNKFRGLTPIDYTTFNGLLFRTIWTLGCPFSCSYCANDSFINLDPGYRKLRYPSVNYIIDEIKQARASHPYISTVAFYDDNFIALPLPLLREFCEKYKRDISLPFVVFGMHPNLITEDKVELLASAGMNRARMGIQSGSKNTLDFFKRPTTTDRIVKAANILSRAAKKHRMIPPAFDIISDNPCESKQDIIETLELIYNLDRPFTLTIFSLRIFNKTKLYDYVQSNPRLIKYFKDSSYLDTRATINNIAFYMLGTFKPPKFIFKHLLDLLRREDGLNREHPFLFKSFKLLYLSKRAFDHLFKFDFSTIVGGWIYYLWKLKVYCLVDGRREKCGLEDEKNKTEKAA